MMNEDDNSKYDADMDDLATSMKMDLDYWWSLHGTRYNGSNCCRIFKVVQPIRESDRNAYEPSVVSIGAYHHGSLSLQAMEKEKLICLDYILKLNCERSLHDYLRSISELENQAKSCYSEEIKMENKEFLQMLLLDGCFILVYLNGMDGIFVPRNVHGEHVHDQELLMENMGHENEEIIGNSAAANWQKASEHSAFEVELEQVDAKQNSTKRDRKKHDSVYDLLLVENQIPFFIVKRICELVSGKDTTTPLLTSNIGKFMEGILYHFPIAIQEVNRPKDFHHLLHLCHIYLRPSHDTEDDYQYQAKRQYFHHILNFGRKFFNIGNHEAESEQGLLPNEQLTWFNAVQRLNRWRRAVEYHEAGVEFRKRELDKHNPHSLLDIKFRNGIMEIPCLPIDDKSALLFRNLVAFEQTCPQFGDDITTYIVFMSQLFSRPDDVTLLGQKGIIVHKLESDEDVSTLFTKLSENVTFNFDGEHYLKSLCCTMEAYYQSRPNRWMAWLRHNHFSNPWMSFAALASAIIVFCTVMQTVLAFVAYMRPPT